MFVLPDDNLYQRGFDQRISGNQCSLSLIQVFKRSKVVSNLESVGLNLGSSVVRAEFPASHAFGNPLHFFA